MLSDVPLLIKCSIGDLGIALQAMSPTPGNCQPMAYHLVKLGLALPLDLKRRHRATLLLENLQQI
jgi:hypothetical protein